MVTAIRSAALDLHSSADLPMVVAQLLEAIDNTGFSLSLLEVRFMDGDADDLDRCRLLSRSESWTKIKVDAVRIGEAFDSQRPVRWVVNELMGCCEFVALPSATAVVAAAAVSQEGDGERLGHFLTAISVPLQLLAFRVRDLRRHEEATRALQSATEELEFRVEERTAELSRALRRIRQEVRQRREAQLEMGEAQERLERVVSSSPAVIYSCRTEGGFPLAFVSENVSKLTGFTSEEILATPRFWIERLHPDDVAGFVETTSSLIQLGRTVCEYRICQKGGDICWVHDEMHLIRGENRRAEVMGSWLDITERKKEEEGRREAERELESQRALSMRSDRLRSLGEMAAGIAHELNQPLVGVRGKAEHIVLGLERGWDVKPEVLKERARSIVEQADRMEHIIEHVRMFAREAGRPKMTPIQVNDVVVSALEMLSAQFRSRGVAIISDLGTDLPSITANSYSLEEVLINLLLNARDAVEDASKQEGSVHLRTCLSDGQARRHVRIEVSDNGTGVQGDYLEKVFEPFYTTKDPNKGTGLGLSVSKSIVEQFDGRIWMESTPGEKTKVTIALPVVAENDETTS